MNCTQQEFEDEIRVHHPHKYLSKEVVPGPWRASETVYVLDTAGETVLPYGTQASLASHVWKDGVVIKDSTGIFNHLSTPPTLNGIPIISPSFAGFPFGPITHVLPQSPAGLSYNFQIQVGSGIDVGWDLSKEHTEKNKKERKCECGAHKVGSNQHSDWCDLKENLCGA